MRRALVVAAVLVAATAVVVLNVGAGDSGGGYKVRAIFDNAVSVISGEDVKIAGAKVGQIDSLDVTPDFKAAVVIRIDDAGFQDFRQDATCTIRPQSLLGEKFVECTPTQPRAVGEPLPPALDRIPSGEPGAGQRLLPISQTSTPVDIDLIQNILRKPYAERFSIILGEFGTAFAGRGDDIRTAIRRADPALQQFDRVLKILADENRVLANLARDSDKVLEPLARDRGSFADFFVQANKAAQATAERSTDLERSIQRFAPFLRQLRPTADQLGKFAEQATPVLADLRAAGPDVSRFFEQVGPITRAGTPAIKSLGTLADRAGPALDASRPVIDQLGAFAAPARPLFRNLAALTASLEATKTIEGIMHFLIYSAGSVNGFDSLSHYLRAQLVVNNCTGYAIATNTFCSANFSGAEGATQASLGSLATTAKARPARERFATRAPAASSAPAGTSPAPAGATTTPQTPAKPTAGAAADPNAGLADYLFGAQR